MNTHHYDYSCIPTSRAHDAECNKKYRYVLKNYQLALKNHTLSKTDKSSYAYTFVAKAAREGNMDLLNEFLPIWKYSVDELWRDLQQTVARGHLDAFCRIAEHMRGNTGVFKGLQAALYFGKHEFVDAIAPYCHELNNATKMKDCVSAALEGKQYVLAQQFMPFAYQGRGMVGALTAALLNRKFDEAEVWYPYSSVKLVRKRILWQPEDKDTIAALEWLEQRYNQEVADKIHKKIRHASSATRMRKM